MSELGSADLARARHRLYALLGQLVADGLQPGLRPTVEALPALAPLSDVDPDTLAAAHHQWFVYELSPHESAFIDGSLDGPATAAFRATLSACGFAHGRQDLADDHLAIQLAAMAHLCAAELEALQDGVDPAPIHRLQERVVAHLGAWLPLLAPAVEGPWSAVVDLALELLASHGPFPAPPPLRDGPINVHRLLVPVECGWVCTWTSLRRAAETVDQPIGFGSKRRGLQTLMAHDDARQAIASAIRQFAERTRAPWTDRARSSADALDARASDAPGDPGASIS